MARTIEYFFSTHSGFAYFGSQKLYEIAHANGCRVVHKPFDFWPVVNAAKGAGWPGYSQAHIAYFFDVEIRRWSARRNAPIARIRPAHHDEPLALSSGLLIAAEQAGADISALAHRILQAHWRDDANIADAATLEQIAASLSLDPAPLLAAAASAEAQAVFAANTREAIRRSVFGSPTYFLEGVMFYGQDRLELIEGELRAHY